MVSLCPAPSALLALLSLAFAALTAAHPVAQSPVGGGLSIPRPGPDGAYAKNHYFQYINVPAENVFEWGYRRGNDPAHFREEYLSQKGDTFKAKLKWGDGYEGQGEMFYDFQHTNSEPYHEAPKYAPPAPIPYAAGLAA